MSLKPQNWKLALLSLIFISLFTGLGFWQLSRGREKQQIISEFQNRTKQPAYTATDLSNVRDWRFYTIELKGKFDNSHTILLDNKIFNGKIGYEVYTPFKAQKFDTPILIDRGFIPLGVSRNALPAVPKATGDSVTVNGMLNLPPRYLSYGQMVESSKIQWPLRVEYINLGEISKLLNETLFPYIVTLDPGSKNALQVKWQVVVGEPNKHTGYAVQWFALAATLLIISVVLNRTPRKKKGRK